MPSNKYGYSETKYKKWIKEGRGFGRNSQYKPWLTVRDVPSDGRSHRIFGHKSQRIHHLLSDLEAAVFLLLEWNTAVTEIREQFPLERDITERLAEDAGICHPKENSLKLYMSSDFLVNANNEAEPKYALQAKYVSALNDIRTVEKLELERRYWNEKEVPWHIVTEAEVPKIVMSNIKWLYPAQNDEIADDVLIERVSFYSYQFQNNPSLSVIELCKKLDTAYQLELGESLLEVRQLLAKRFFDFDIFVPTTKLKGADMSLGDVSLIGEALRVSNQ